MEGVVYGIEVWEDHETDRMYVKEPSGVRHEVPLAVRVAFAEIADREKRPLYDEIRELGVQLSDALTDAANVRACMSMQRETIENLEKKVVELKSLAGKAIRTLHESAGEYDACEHCSLLDLCPDDICVFDFYAEKLGVEL